ncbi:hypothetical protein JX265_014151, partial [Neoarthrinium moseri]
MLALGIARGSAGGEPISRPFPATIGDPRSSEDILRLDDGVVAGVKDASDSDESEGGVVAVNWLLRALT